MSAAREHERGLVAHAIERETANLGRSSSQDSVLLGVMRGEMRKFEGETRALRGAFSRSGALAASLAQVPFGWAALGVSIVREEVARLAQLAEVQALRHADLKAAAEHDSLRRENAQLQQMSAAERTRSYQQSRVQGFDGSLFRAKRSAVWIPVARHMRTLVVL